MSRFRVLHASTGLLRSHAQFLTFANKARELAHGNVLLFALSHDCPDLESAVSKLSSSAKETVGCLSGPIPLQNKPEFFSCSVAVLSRDSCVPFSVREAGLPPTSIGRNHAYFGGKPRDDGSESMGDGMLSAIQGWKENVQSETRSRYLPDELRGVSDAKSLLYFSDKTPAGLAASLFEKYTNSVQLGMSGSSTPFVTGRPFTLFRNGKVQSSGAVGLALSSSPTSTSFSCDDLVRLTPPLPVTRAEGNLIHETGDSLPARILVTAIQEHGLPNELAKDVDYYISVKDSELDGIVTPRLLKIIAGSPSRGSIAVEDVAAPAPGTSIEFYYRQHAAPVLYDPGRTRPEASQIFIGSLATTLDVPNINASNQSKDAEGGKTFDNTFLVASEHGFTLSSGSLSRPLLPWRCTVPSAVGGLQFPML